jgi:hypothetical protein
MLHLNTIDEPTHKTLIAVQSINYLQKFSLVRGTNLSLRLGYRKSINLDFFSVLEFDLLQLNDLLQIDFEYDYRSNNKYMLFSYINKIKVDWVYVPFPLLQPIEVIDQIRFFPLRMSQP